LSKLSFFKNNSQVRSNRGQIISLKKGKIIKCKSVSVDYKKCWSNNYYVLINLINIKKKTFSLVKYANGSMSYIQSTFGFFIGDCSYTTKNPKLFWTENSPGVNVMLCFLKKLSIINNVFLNKKPTFSKANGTFSQILEIYDDCDLVTIIIPSGEYKILLKSNFATLGRCYNYLYSYSNFGKAGNLKIVGHKPKVRGVAKNPVDSFHGGRTKTNKPEVSPWGWVAKHNK